MRLHQLAKDLNLNAKDLAPHLKKLGIQFKNHMSAISEDDVARIKNLLHPPTPESVVEQRLRPTVIRRRRKEQDEPSAEAPADSTEASASPPPVPAEPVQPEAEALQGTEAEAAAAKSPAGQAAAPEPKQAPSEQIPAQEAAAEKKPEQKPSKIKIISTGMILPEEEEEVKKGPAKKKKRSRERFFPAEEAPPKKLIPLSSKELEEQDLAPQIEEPAKITKIFPPRKKKGFALVKGKKTAITVPKAIKRKIRIVAGITVGELAKRMSVKAAEVIKKLMQLGVMASLNETIDADAATLAAHEFGYEIETVKREEEQILMKKQDAPEALLPRAPIVTVMGHIDHGKTSLLDAIRQTNVTETEAGGITQHIGAYNVRLDRGNIVFIDTPGHEAFTTMRARGAKVTDIVVLVIAADDGVMPQTVEAIDHSKAAGVPIIVTINKIDKPNADPERIKQALTEFALLPEEWGGDTLYAQISAKQRTGIESLMDTILLQAEILELKANPNKPAEGTVIEARLDKNRGIIATILVQEGTLKIGDTFISGVHFGKVRSLINDLGEPIQQAGPSTPVQVIGLTGMPDAGDTVLVIDEEKKARQAGMYLQQKQREQGMTESGRITLEGLQNQIKEGTVKELNVIIKVDVQGSLDAITKSLADLGNETVKISLIHSAVGAINQSDVMLASASRAIIIGFGVKPDPKAKQLAEQEKVDIRYYTIIYDAISDVKNALEGLLAPTVVEKLSGKAEVRQVFQLSKQQGTIAGSMVTEGKITRGIMVRLTRNGTMIHQGKVTSLKRFKDNVREVEAGHDCGIGIEGFDAIEAGDIIECYTIEEFATKL
jgi:translation initiation factor IF-2